MFNSNTEKRMNPETATKTRELGEETKAFSRDGALPIFGPFLCTYWISSVFFVCDLRSRPISFYVLFA